MILESSVVSVTVSLNCNVIVVFLTVVMRYNECFRLIHIGHIISLVVLTCELRPFSK
uniref:Uncharacterized protein n=1 Tax=Arundo donax TaxID=35708 RepID=A0A0A9HL21_ARUDO